MVDYDLCHCHCHTVPHLVIKGVTRCRTFFENLTVKQIFLEKYESFVIEVFVVFIAVFVRAFRFDVLLVVCCFGLPETLARFVVDTSD